MVVDCSVDALNAMLKVCELYAGEHDITFNSSKTKLMHFTMNNQSPGSIKRSFTNHITGMNDMPYHERLKSLGLYSLQRRRERYCIIYINY